MTKDASIMRKYRNEVGDGAETEGAGTGRAGLTAEAVAAMDGALAEVFGRYSAGWQPRDPLANLIRIILHQRTTGPHAARALENLQAHCPDWAAVAALPYDLLVDLVRPAGLAKSKAASIQALLQQVCLDTGAYSLDVIKEMESPAAARYLSTLPGVGALTASLVLLFALGRPGVMPVDGHVHRVVRRLGWTQHDASARTVQQTVEAAAPALPLMDLHCNLIELGHRHCGPSTLDCADCPVNHLCATALRQPWW